MIINNNFVTTAAPSMIFKRTCDSLYECIKHLGPLTATAEMTNNILLENLKPAKYA